MIVNELRLGQLREQGPLVVRVGLQLVTPPKTPPGLVGTERFLLEDRLHEYFNPLNIGSYSISSSIA